MFDKEGGDVYEHLQSIVVCAYDRPINFVIRRFQSTRNANQSVNSDLLDRDVGS